REMHVSRRNLTVPDADESSRPSQSDLTHFDESGHARMVDVGDKAETTRIAAKGDVLGVARVAGIMAAKRTWQLVPMCHPLLLTKIEINYTVGDDVIDIEAQVETN